MEFIFTNPASITKPNPRNSIIKPPSMTKPSAGYKKKCTVLFCVVCVQVCRERETAAITTASSLQSERNCSYYDRFKSAEREKLQLLLYYCTIVILYYCTTTTDPPSIVNPPYPGQQSIKGGGLSIGSQH